jgi:hypothetical protein
MAHTIRMIQDTDTWLILGRTSGMLSWSDAPREGGERASGGDGERERGREGKKEGELARARAIARVRACARERERRRRGEEEEGDWHFRTS